MILTATTNRFASILLQDGSCTKNFKLERGNAQGDCPSPLLFNLCNQILIFKIELDPSIEAAFPPSPNRRTFMAQNPDTAFESNRETGKIDCFADDATCILKLTLQNLLNLKAILSVFEDTSGLAFNLKKSTLMITGANEPFNTRDLGFQLADSFTLL